MKSSAKRIARGKTMSARLRREIGALATKPDIDIDYSDIPSLDDDFFKNAVSNPFYRPIKRQLTVRLDADVIAWLRTEGKGYQTRLNNLLRAAMLREASRR